MTMPIEHPAGQREPTFDLAAYLARIGFDGALDQTFKTLSSLHFAHVSAIPFENLDIVLGRRISLDLGDLQAKLVTSRRGGYCFEQNALFAAALESLGFTVLRLAARVRFGSTEIRPRTHMLLEVEAEKTRWLSDVGFGAGGLLYPIELHSGEPFEQGAGRTAFTPKTTYSSFNRRMPTPGSISTRSPKTHSFQSTTSSGTILPPLIPIPRSYKT